MKTLLLRSLSLLLVLSPMAAHAAPQANDKFANATPLTSRVSTLRNQNGATATGEALDPYILGVKPAHSLWYRVDITTPSANNQVTVNHTVLTRVGVYKLNDTDGGAGSLTFLAAATFGVPGTGSQHVDTISSGSGRYYICVECDGVFDLTVKIAGQSNDFFEDAIELTGAQGNVTGNNTNATDTSDTPSTLPSTRPYQGVWYKWVAPSSVQMAFDTSFSFLLGNAVHDTVINVFTGSDLTNLVSIATDDDGGYDFNSRVSFAAVAGTTYYIWVGDFNSDGTGSGNFALNYYPETSPGTYTIVALTPQVSENQGFARVEVRRRNGGTIASNVTVTTSNGAATAGLDYTAVNQVLNFSGTGGAESNTHVVVNIPILTDTIADSGEAFIVTLSSPTSGAVLSTPSSATIIIADSPTTSVPGFATGTLRVKETDGTIIVPLTRSNTVGTANYSIRTRSGGDLKAVPSVNFFPIAFTDLVVDGQSTNFITLTIINNGRAEGDRSFGVSIRPEGSGTIVDGSSELIVTITDDDALQPAPGRLSGILSNTNVDASVDITVSATGTLTGKLIMAKAAYPFTGKLDASGALTVKLALVNGVPTRTLVIQQLNSADGVYSVTLNDLVFGNQATSQITATTFSALNPCQNQGLYSFADGAGGGGIPQILAGSLKVDALGTATLTGKIFDGTAIVATGGVGPSGIANIGATLYAGQGRFISTIPLPTTVQTYLGTTYKYMRPGRASQSVELPSLTLPSVNAFVSIYTPPTVGSRILSVWNPAGAGNADLTGGGFGALTTQPIVVSTSNVVTLNGGVIPSLKLTLTPATGLYTGTVIPPAGVIKPIYGVLFQAGISSVGRGFFLNGVTPGRANLR